MMTSPPSLQNVAVSVESQAIAVVKLNRPKALNALNTATVKDVLEALRWAEANDAIKVIIMTGEGRMYTAGLDLLDQDVQAPNATVCDAFVDTLTQVHELLITTPKIIISAVNGPAPGWGTSSLALSDLVYTIPTAFFFTPFVQWGLCAEACSSLTFARIMGRQKASALILAGSRMTAQELESAGLVTKIFPQENFWKEVLGVARGMCKLPAQTLRLNKEMMMGRWRGELLEVNRVEMETLRRQAGREESRTAIGNFAKAQEAKRKGKGAKL